MPSSLRTLIQRLFRTPLHGVVTIAFFVLVTLGFFGTVAYFTERPGIFFGISHYAFTQSILSGVLIFLGAGLLYRGVESLFSKKKLVREEAPVLCVILILIMRVTFFQNLLQDDAKKIGDATERQVKWVSAQVQQVLDGHVLSIERMGARWDFRGGVSKEEWVDDAVRQFNDLPGVAMVGWIDRTGFFRWAYPAHKLAPLANVSHLTDPSRREIFIGARDSGKTTFSPLIDFKSGGRGFAAVVPVHRKDGTFDGTVTMALEIGPFLERSFPTRGFRIQFFEGDKIFFDTAKNEPSNPSQDESFWSRSVSFNYRSLQWRIQAIPLASEVVARSNPLVIPVFWSGLIAAFMFSMVVRLYLAATIAKERAWEAVEWQAAILNGSDLGVVSADVNGLVLSVNPAAEKMLGYRVEEVRGVLLPLIWHDPEELRARAEALSLELGRRVEPNMDVFFCKPNTVNTHEWTIIRKDGERRTAIISVHALRASKGKITGFVGILDDITERKNQQKKIIDQQAVMVHSAKLASLGEMAAGIAHEINNPLLVISGKVQQIRRSHELGKSEPEQTLLHAEVIRKTVERIAKIISGVRNFSRDSSGDPYSPASVTKLLTETTSFCIERFHNQAVELRVRLPEDDFEVDCRAYQISQVLLNLLNNAFDAAFERPSGNRWVEITVRKLSSWQVEFIVRDSGIGVPSTLRAKIMQPFFTTKEIGKGTGLGLSISQGIVRDHGGEIVLDAKSTVTSFHVILPITQSDFTD